MVRIDSAGTSVATQRLRARIALLTLQGSPSADTGGAHSEPLTSFTMRSAGSHSRQNTNPKINR